MANKPETFTKKNPNNELQLLPLVIAGALCFVIGTSSGAVSWYFFGSNSPRNAQKIANEKTTTAVALPNGETGKNVESNNAAAQNTPTAQPSLSPAPATEVSLAAAGEVAVEGGEFALGGGSSKRPVQRVFVKPFAVAETEVTIGQFREFVEAEKNSNEALKNFKMPAGKDDEPVTMVSWDEAKAYCDWLARKINAEVRLPTEAEWELAARGKNGFVYPWGNEWRDGAAAYKEIKGTIRPVKTTPINKSPYGAFDMAGNVWEWTADKADDKDSYVLKGGSFADGKANISGQARDAAPHDTRLEFIGFRYVVLRGGNAAQTQNAAQQNSPQNKD